VDIALLEHCLREDLNKRAPRAMGVLKPCACDENYPRTGRGVRGGEQPEDSASAREVHSRGFSTSSRTTSARSAAKYYRSRRGGGRLRPPTS